MPTCCCVPGCSTRGGLSFPKEEKIKKLWIRAIRRNDEDIAYKHWTPQPFSVVCHKHFREEDFTCETQHGTEPLRRQRKPEAVPSIFPWTKSPSINFDERSKRVVARRAKMEKGDHENSEMVSDDCNVYEVGNSVEVEG
ncbi:THAP domain-containing protein 6-like [Saccostrea cucullata]|uniref:THAP domain-containing protein 6-like n=1 Tax=Saccostrea cuccullata TaxID=36930 RepID=UPI002ED29A5B